MHRSSESVGLIATALAKAQCELVNPEKTMTGVLPPQPNGRPEQSFRYASLASGLDIIRKTLGKHEIAVMQTTAPDSAGTVILTTLLAHTSGEWVSSEWPVCPSTDIAMPRRMGAALTYARRYSLFTLVGIAGEDDLDAPDFKDGAEAKITNAGAGTSETTNQNASRQMPVTRPRYKPRDVIEPAPLLNAQQSADLRDRLIKEADKLDTNTEAVAWATSTLPAKNTLITADAVLVEEAFQSRLAAITSSDTDKPKIASSQLETSSSETIKAPIESFRRPGAAKIDKTVLTISEPRRVRDKQHLKFVASKPCLVCGRSPADAHHVRYAQASAMSRKVSDEFTVPLCRTHHDDLHRHGQEQDWWGSNGIDPLSVAAALWQESRGVGLSATQAVKP